MKRTKSIQRIDGANKDIETEVALIICSDRAFNIARQIAKSASIGGYKLKHKGSQSIHDIYFDEPNCTLQTKRLALRLREISGAYKIGLKGPGKPTGRGEVKRLEIEAPWSRHALTKILNELKNRGVKLQLKRLNGLGNARPLEVMDGLGLQIIQNRRTNRKVREARAPGGAAALAELAIDHVVHYLDNHKVHYYEVEIEKKSRLGSAAIETLTDELITRYKPALRVWAYPKLAIGMALENLLQLGMLDDLVSSNGNLKPDAFYQINNYIKHHNI